MLTNVKNYREKTEYWLAKTFGWTLDYIRGPTLSYADVQTLIKKWNEEQISNKREIEKQKRLAKMKKFRGRR